MARDRSKSDDFPPTPADGAPPDESGYDIPAELAEPPEPRRRKASRPSPVLDAELPPEEPSTRPAGSRRALQVGIGVAVLLLAGGGILWYRAHHRAAVIRQALAEADALMQLDTAAAFRAAADKLELPAELDPVAGGSARAFALAMLFCDYGDRTAEAAIEDLLVPAERAAAVPEAASLARAALALGRRALGDASTSAGHAQGPWAQLLLARSALAADQPAAAVDPASAVASNGAFAAGLAVQGDVARRARKDPAAARAAYSAALAASGGPGGATLGASPRATFGLAKLALAGQAPASEAIPALTRLLGDPSTLAPERARAALHLAALRIREGDAAGADTALEAIPLDAAARTWARRAARAEASARGPYRAVVGAPEPLRSRVDDDPPEVILPPPEPPAPAVVPTPPARPAVKPPPRRLAPTPAAAPKRPGARKGVH